MGDRPSLAALVAVVVLVGSCCCCIRVEASSSPAAAESDELMSGGAGGGRTTWRRRAASVMVPITILKSAVSKGAVCMDGTPPAYNLDPGSGPGSRSWILNLEGGAWCDSAHACRLSKGSGRGSSDHMEKEIPFTGIMSSSRAVNPGPPAGRPSIHASSLAVSSIILLLCMCIHLVYGADKREHINISADFYNWNRVKIRYCDGGSFAGEAFDKAAGIYFRGQRIWNAVIRHLLSIGMSSADQVLLTGCSSGGLAVILHCDKLRSFLTGTTVKCLSDAGLYLDAVDVSGGHSVRSYFRDIVAMQGIAQNLPPDCTARLDATSCFFPQNIIDGIKTPMFLLNAAYDVIQMALSLAPDRADPSGAWRACKYNRTACNASQMSVLQDFRDHMLASVKGFSGSQSNGLFISSCFAHCQSEQLGTWNMIPSGSPTIQNKGIAKSVGDWYFDRAEVKAI